MGYVIGLLVGTGCSVLGIYIGIRGIRIALRDRR